ncbi:MAG: hypothetical protein MZV63_46125 [Marinilabiliales bacterium]|nr:hypothetical protein [Marinilabiliales bacterium]
MQDLHVRGPFQKWRLCPLCGHAYEVAKVPAYLEVEDHHEAEHIVKQMEKHLHANKKKDFTPEEKEELRHHYTTALRKKQAGGCELGKLTFDINIFVNIHTRPHLFQHAPPTLKELPARGGSRVGNSNCS